MRRELMLVLALVAGLSGCGKKTASVAPKTGLPPEITGVFPPSRSVRVPYDTPIWARFREPLDSTTVSATTVFLKVDTRRIPVRVSLEDSAMRIVIRPLVDLGVRQTHTIEISPRVRTVSGASFSDSWFWQFTTTSVRHIQNPEPREGRTGESPFAPLFWRGTEANAGPIEYRVFASTDSSQVAAGTVPAIVVGTPYYLPQVHWTAAPWFWKVSVRNLETGDEDQGPVWRFDVIPSDTPVDSLTLPRLDYGSWDRNAGQWRCGALTSSNILMGVARFAFGTLDSEIVVANAWVAFLSNATTQRFPQMFALTKLWVPCSPASLGIPPAGNFLGDGYIDSDSRMRFASDLLAAQIQGRIRRHPELFDYAFASQLSISYSPLEAGSGVRIYFYRPASIAAVAHGRTRPR